MSDVSAFVFLPESRVGTVVAHPEEYVRFLGYDVGTDQWMYLDDSGKVEWANSYACRVSAIREPVPA